MADQPLVETSIVRLMKARMRITHEERGISVISGPWGIGKTTAINAFVEEVTEGGQLPLCAVVKVEPGGNRGVSAIAVMQQVISALVELHSNDGRRYRVSIGRAYFPLRREVHHLLSELFWDGETSIPFTLIFDEAQYLSREAIEMLRYWNDRDRTTTPFPVGLIFVGNNEFAMAEGLGRDSVIAGAVRSRLLFEEALSYEHLSETDLVLFCQSRGVTDASALRVIVSHYNHPADLKRRPAPKRDLRRLEKLITAFHRRADGGPVTADIIEVVLNPQ